MTSSASRPTAVLDNSVFFKKSAFFKLWLFVTILLIHAMNYEAYGLREAEGAAAALLYFIEILIFKLSWLAVVTYYFLSGYSFMLGFELSKTVDKLRRRIWSLLIPRILWNTIMWLFGIAVESIPALSQHLNSGFGYELSLASWVRDGLLRPADDPFWFMSNLIVMMLLSPLVYLLVKNRYIGVLAIVANFAAIYITEASRYSVLMTLVFFMQSAYFATHLRHLVRARYGWLPRLIAGVLLVSVVLFVLESAIYESGIFFALSFSISVPALWVVFGDVSLGSFGRKAEKYRFWLCASHYLPLECVEKLWLIVGGVSVGTAWAGMIICPALTIVLLVAASMLLERLCYPFWCLLNGKKPTRRTKTA